MPSPPSRRIRQLDFHSALFAAQPAVIKPDDASRRFDNPRQFCDRDSRSRDLIRGRDEPLAQGAARPVVKQGRTRDLLRSMRSNAALPMSGSSPAIVPGPSASTSLVANRPGGCGCPGLPGTVVGVRPERTWRCPAGQARSEPSEIKFVLVVGYSRNWARCPAPARHPRPAHRSDGPHGRPREPPTIAQNGAGDQPVPWSTTHVAI